MSEALQQRSQKEQYEAYVARQITNVIAGLPLVVPDEDLKRARARFRVAFSADANEKLLECSANSIARAIVLSTMSGLFPGGPKPDVWLIPRGKEVNWQLSFRGYIRLARRSGWDMEPVLVYAGEEFRVEEGMEPRVHHVRNLDVEPSWETLRYAYVRIISPAGRIKVAYLNRAQIQQRRNVAQTQEVWTKWPLEMALKTICNYAGNREMFPLDDPSRYAIEATEHAEIGGGAPARLGATTPAALPAGQEDEGATIDVAGKPEYAPAGQAPQRMREPGEDPEEGA